MNDDEIKEGDLVYFDADGNAHKVVIPDADKIDVKDWGWTTDPPTTPGFYWAVGFEGLTVIEVRTTRMGIDYDFVGSDMSADEETIGRAGNAC
jgi:hypothetical protein